ncbi:MAG: NAD(P)/FAD-dependent oxidoreductase [Patescibacteria group bacterium]
MKVAIIGGGAAGLMASAALHEINQQVKIFILEKNDALGKKIIISGGGRCNLTTGLPGIKIVLSKYPRGGKFLSSAMRQFSPTDVFKWFEAHGIPLKIESDQRVFPKSNNGHDVVLVFEKIFKHSSIQTLINTKVLAVKKHTLGFELTLDRDSQSLITDKLVLTTGGQAYRQTGSTGDGYAFAVSLGHSLTKLAPSLSALATHESWPKNISGLSIDKTKLTAKNKTNTNVTGPILFTHHGISGPAVFALSSLVAFEKFSPKKPLTILVDLFPDQSTSNLYDSLKKNITDNLKKDWLNVLSMLIPKSLAQIANQELLLNSAKHAAEMSKQDLTKTSAWLKNIPLNIVGRSAGNEFVTAGGVNLKEINPATMESKICPGLYFAGEILDIDGFTGGFNLQSSWATGHLAGASIAKLNLSK